MIVGNRSFVSRFVNRNYCVFHSEGKFPLCKLVVKRWWIGEARAKSTILQYDRCNVVNPPGFIWDEDV